MTQPKTECHRRHELRAPNLAGAGKCLACSVAKARVRRNPTKCLDEVADLVYSEIIATTEKETLS